MVGLCIGGSGRHIIFYLKLGLIIYLFILVRGTLPRFRYDKLIHLAWKAMLPGVLFRLFLVTFFLFLI
jgi:NADH-ubiquinone oxidoreductase chain 1